jgi:hypothetical protein
MQQVAHVEPLGAAPAISERTFAELLTPLIEPGFRLALAMLHDPQAAEDAVQDASFTRGARWLGFRTEVGFARGS